MAILGLSHTPLAGKMWLRSVYVYDDQGLLKEELTYHGDGSLRSKKTFKRDELAHALEVSEYSAHGVLQDQLKNTFDGPLLLTTERKPVTLNQFRKRGSMQTAYKKAAPESGLPVLCWLCPQSRLELKPACA
jgi:hypothetical protein